MPSPGPDDASPSPDYSGPEGSDTGDLDIDLDLDPDMTAHHTNDPRGPEHVPDTKPNGTAKSSAKDPTRPRRKKARRACFACQRAHLTCGESTLCPCLDGQSLPRRPAELARRRAALPALHQARSAGPLHGRRAKEGKIPS